MTEILKSVKCHFEVLFKNYLKYLTKITTKIMKIFKNEKYVHKIVIKYVFLIKLLRFLHQFVSQLQECQWYPRKFQWYIFLLPMRRRHWIFPQKGAFDEPRYSAGNFFWYVVWILNDFSSISMNAIEMSLIPRKKVSDVFLNDHWCFLC